jgi:uncharacterized protein YdaU (DUF1376 family)
VKPQRPQRLDWFAFYPSDFVNSPDVVCMSATARGCYISILAHCWMNASNGCKVPCDDTYLRTITNCSAREWSKVKQEVLRKFKVDDKNCIFNDRLTTEFDQVCKMSEENRKAAQSKWEPEPVSNQRTEGPTAVRPLSDRTAVVERKLSYNNTIDDSTVHDNTEHNSTTEKAGDVLSSMENEHIDETNLGALKKGEPGYFHRGQYPGTKPKAIFAYIANVWSRFKGEAAFARYPSKYPESFEDLCGAKSGDLIVPAFELWCDAEGKHLSTQWPTADFVKVAEKYMAKVIPLNLSKPAVTEDMIAEIVKQDSERHAKLWGAPVVATEDPTALTDLFGPSDKE